MSSRIASFVLLAVTAPLAASGAEVATLETDVQKFSYGIGLQIAHTLRQQGLGNVDAAAIAQAIDDVVNEREMRLTLDEMRAAQEGYQAAVMQERETEAGDNATAGATFLAENAAREGIASLDSGVQYRVIAAGDGDIPTETDAVTVHYRGWLLDGTQFDSSFDRGQPAQFTVGQVIPGWQQALQLMPVGSHWEVWIPSELAYGQKGAGGTIGPNETLHFEIQLIAIDGG